MKKTILRSLITGICMTVAGQVSTSSDLFKIIRQRDSLVFDIGFNQCRLTVYDSILSNDLEFYHDVGGLSQGKEAFVLATKNNICGSADKIKRELVPGTLEVFPLYNQGILYGAIAEGVHEFFIQTNGQWKKTGRARFTILWLQEATQWKMKRALSYDHKAVNPENPGSE